MTSDEATKWIGEWIGLSASMIRSGEDFTPTAEEVHKKARTALSTILSALSASQAEVERLTRERDEWRGRAADRDHEAEQRARKQWDAEARATRAEEEIARRDAVAKASWGDQKDQHTDAILAAHPTYTKDFETYNAALAMVSTRHGKYELVNLVNWLLARATRAEGLLEEAGEAFDAIAVFAQDSLSCGNLYGGDVGNTMAIRDAARAFLDKLKGEG